MNKLFNYRVLPILLLVLIIGILTASFLHFAYAIALVVISLLAIIICLNTKKFRKFTSKAIMIGFGIIIAVASTYVSFAIAEQSSSMQDNGVVISGRVSGVSNYDHDGNVNDNYFYLDNATVTGSNGANKKLGGYVKIYYEDSGLKLGDRVVLRGDIKPIGVELSNQEYIGNYRDRIYNIMYANDIVSSEVGKIGFFDGIKLKVKQMYYDNSLGNVGGFMYAMMFGDSSGIDPQIRAESGAIGVAHLFAVSGLHVGMIALVLVFFMDKLRLKAFVQAIITILVLLVYNFLCGFSASVVRASVMIIVGHIARIIGFKNDSISTLSFAGISVLAFSPFSLFDVSFIMSFIAVLGIVYFNKTIKNKLVFLPNYLSGLISMTISVNIGLIPVMIMYFGNLSLIFTLSNMLVIPIVTFAYPIMFICTIIGITIPFLGVLIYPVSVLFLAISSIISLIATLPFATVDFNITIAILVVFIVLITILSKYVFLPKLFKRIIAIGLALTFVCGVIISSVGVFNQNNDIKSMYLDGYSNQAYYHISSGGKDYLLLNGDISLKAFKMTLNRTIYNNIDEYDGIILDGFKDEDEMKLVDKYFRLLNCRAIYMREYYNDMSKALSIAYKMPFNNKYEKLEFGVSGEILLTLKSNRLLFYNSAEYYPSSNLKYNVVFPAVDAETVNKLNYDYIVTRNLNYATNAEKIGFTFRINRGKIIA